MLIVHLSLTEYLRFFNILRSDYSFGKLFSEGRDFAVIAPTHEAVSVCIVFGGSRTASFLTGIVTLLPGEFRSSFVGEHVLLGSVVDEDSN